MTWRDQNGQIDGFVTNDNESSVIEKGPYTLTLVSIEKYDGEFFANFTSTLEVMVDNITNRTNISCALFMNRKHLVIYKISNLQKQYCFAFTSSYS